jgi:hypothetical protein
MRSRIVKDGLEPWRWFPGTAEHSAAAAAAAHQILQTMLALGDVRFMPM